MPQTTDCPSFQDLVQLVCGEVPPPEGQRLGQHVLACPECKDSVHGMTGGDTLLAHLTGDTPAPAPAGQPFATLAPPSPDAASVSEPATVLPANTPEQRLGPYRVLRTLGMGGMGMVYHAEDTELGRPVALKVMRPELGADPSARQRFLREARAAAGIKNDHIVTIYQVGQQADTPYLAMEFLVGETLDARLDRDRRLPLAEALRIARETATGLAAAHEQGLIHRDIKPANLWLEAGTGRVKILDFGLARPIQGQTQLTASGQIIGTPQYMAPEQARGVPTDARCDLFSLGAVLYRMLAGHPPFVGSDILAVLAALALEPPPPLGTDVPPAVAALVDSLLAKKPEGRPASARAVIEAIRQIEAGTAAPVDQSATPAPVAAPPRTKMSTVKARLAKVALPRPGFIAAGIFGVALLVGGALFGLGRSPAANRRPGAAGTAPGEPIRVGILHSLSGTMADSGNAVTEATLLAIKELNKHGGVLGQPVEPVVRDGQSDWHLFADKAERLITEDKVATIFGCWTSSGRKAVRDVVERHDHLLIYPVQYEGLEQSANIVYNGAAPNQQIIPAAQYCYAFLHKRRFFLVGSDYVFPRTANAILRDTLQSLGAAIVGEEYVPLGGTEVGAVIDKIVKAQPDAILNTINGDSNRAFFRALRAAGVTPQRATTVSFSIAEPELRLLDIRDMVGDYAAWNYFQSVDDANNRAFVQRFREKYGPQRVTSDPMEAAYFGVHLWAKAVAAAGSIEPRAIREAIKDQTYDAPEGPVRIDPATLHTWKTVRLGHIIPGGQFEIVYESGKPVRPEPYPSTRSHAQWDDFLTRLSASWGGRWSPEGR